MRKFPWDFEAKKEILFYPEQPEEIAGHILEIGPGRGDFILSVSEKLPERKIFAVELGKRRYFKMIPRIKKRGLKNLVMVQGHARIVIDRFIKPESFDKIYVLFPDPWPKKRHYLHRLMSVAFMQELATLLRPGGMLYSATDFWPYARWTVENAMQVENLEFTGKPFFGTIDDIAYYSPSFFEQKWRDEGRAIYYMAFRKV